MSPGDTPAMATAYRVRLTESATTSLLPPASILIAKISGYGRTPHDFRRTAARNLIRAGVPQHVVMKLCGWKTDAMFRRYAIVDERDLRDAVELLAKGTTGPEAHCRSAVTSG